MMRPVLRERVLGALALGPMTSDELARSLGSTVRATHAVACALADDGVLVRWTRSSGRGRPWVVFALASRAAA